MLQKTLRIFPTMELILDLQNVSHLILYDPPQGSLIASEF